VGGAEVLGLMLLVPQRHVRLDPHGFERRDVLDGAVFGIRQHPIRMEPPAKEDAATIDQVLSLTVRGWCADRAWRRDRST
jgi:hypothetical protein